MAKAKESGESELQHFKQTNLLSSEDPDVTIVVGGQEFKEYRSFLRCLSGYFDAAYRSGMKEATTNRFTFPDKDPEDWQLLMDLSAPYTTQMISERNVRRLLPWYDMLQISLGLKSCDKVFCERIVSPIFPKKWGNRFNCVPSREQSGKKFQDLLDALETSISFNLPLSISKCIESLKRVSTEGGQFLFNEKNMEQIIRFLKYENCKCELWRVLVVDFLPKSIVGKIGMDALIDNGLLPSLILSGIHQHGLKTLLGSSGQSLLMMSDLNGKRNGFQSCRKIMEDNMPSREFLLKETLCDTWEFWSKDSLDRSIRRKCLRIQQSYDG